MLNFNPIQKNNNYNKKEKKLDDLIKLAVTNPITAITIVAILALSSKYAWGYFGKSNTNQYNLKLAEINLEQRLKLIDVALDQHKDRIDDIEEDLDKTMIESLTNIEEHKKFEKELKEIDEIKTNIRSIKEVLVKLHAKIKSLEDIKKS